MLSDLRHAIRLLLKSPGFTVLAVLTLGIGIGANVTVFSIVEAVLLRALPLPQSQRLVRIYSDWEPAWPYSEVSVPDFQDWKGRNTVFDEMAAFRTRQIALEGNHGAEEIPIATVSPNYFKLMGVEPSVGRGFLPNEDSPAQGHVVILTEGLSRQLFGSAEAALGHSIQLNAETYSIVGIAPAWFHLPDESVQLWLPLVFNRGQSADRGNRWLQIFGRLKPGVTITQAGIQMADIAANLAREDQKNNTGFGVRLVPLREDMVGSQRVGLLMLQGAVACTLLIASFNLANLLLSRALNRKREFAIRASLGASRWRLARQSLAESLLLGLSGGILGIILANWGIRVFTFLAKDHLARASEIHMNALGLLFSLVLTVSIGTICGLLPALAVADRRGPQNVLRETSRGSAGGLRQTAIRNGLVIAEIGCALVVLSCAGLLLRSFLKVEETDSGIQHPEEVLTASLSLPPARYPSDGSIRSFYQSVQEKVALIPGVKSAGAISLLPLTGGDTDTGFQIVGRPSFAPGHEPVAQFRVISGDYFQSAGVPLIAGRLFSAEDGPEAPPRILINRSMALRFWKNPQEALGNRIDNEAGWTGTIIGVVANVHHFGLTAPVRDEFYYPVSQAPHYGIGGASLALSMVLVVHAAEPIDPRTLTNPLRQKIAEIDPMVPLDRIKPWSQLIADSIGDRSLNLCFVGSFAVVALILAAMGIYSVISYSVAQRTREIAVRAAIGAQRRDLLYLLLIQAGKLISIGIAVGLFAAVCLTQLMQGLLYGVAAADPATFLGVIILLVSVSLAANYLPVRRAMNINPVTALRQE